MLRLLFFIFIYIFCSTSVFAGKYNNVSSNFYKVEILDVYDGDTIFVEVDYSPTLSERFSLRIAGIDTPEMKRYKCEAEYVKAVAARDFLKKNIEGGSVFISNVKLGKYAGRKVADLYLTDKYVRDLRGFSGAKNISDLMLKNGFAVKYNGKKKDANWCD